MKLRTIKDIKEVKGKRFLVRVDLNAPIKDGHLGSTDLWKLRASIHTVEYITERGGSVIILSHFGRPDGRRDAATSMKRVVKKFAQLLGQPIEVWDYPVTKWLRLSHKLQPGTVVALENLRWHKGEESNSPQFSKQLAALGDYYVNDAFGVIQRKHASTYGITKYRPSYAGFLLEYEVRNLYNLLSRAKRPIVAVMGGSKIGSKIGLIKKMLDRVDYVLLGGALANNVLMARNVNIGRSLVDREVKALDGYLMDNKLRLPVDARVASSLKTKSRITAIGKVRASEIIYDLGPDTVELYAAILKKAKTVIWNGPLGYFEDQRYAWSTRKLIEQLAAHKSEDYVGGGETVKAVLQSRLEDRLHFVSTGGGAMLALLENPKLPVLQQLIKK